MTPTQAQIDAAAKAVEEAYKCYGTEFTTIAICALTAAAGAAQTEAAGPINHEEAKWWALRFYETSNIARCYLALTTAAEMGDCTAEIIERCAQVAEWFSNVEKFTAEDVAARIRALKDTKE